MTEGPIGFAHVYLDPKKMDHVVTEEFDRDSRQVELLDRVADHLPLLSALMSGLLDELETPTVASRLLLDTLFHAITVRVLSECSTLSKVSSSARHTISPRRLRRVLDYIDSHLSTDIGLQDLAAVAGSSRFHFSRAFRDATGTPPYRYLIQRRVDAAKSLLLQDALSISQVAENCGFNSRSQFATMFKRVNGTSPARYRREH
jgi:AraC family transcriptional regulator